MEHISLLLAILLLSVQIDNSEQGDNADFCDGSRIVDAATFSAVDRRNIILYSGAYYWELDVDTKRIIRSQKINKTFPEVEDNIDAACSVSSYDEGGYMFLKGDKVWTYIGSMAPTLNITVNLYDFAERHGIKYGDDRPGIGCVACYCHDPENCHVILVDKGTLKKSIGCLFNYGESLTTCRLYNKIQMPERIRDDLLSDIQECYGLTYAMDPEQPTTIVAVDQTRMFYFQNNDLMYSTPLLEIFKCSDLNTLYYTGGSVLLFIILLIIVLIIIWRIKLSYRDEASPLMRETLQVSKNQAESEKLGKKETGKTMTTQKAIAKAKEAKILKP